MFLLLLFGTRLWWFALTASFAMTTFIEIARGSIPGRVPDERDLRRGDLPARWGGEEFVALLPGVDGAGLVAAAERIRMLVANSWMDHAGKRLRVTVSVGATLAHPGESPGDLVDRADHLMYQSKGAGRNQVTTDTDPTAVALNDACVGPSGEAN